jgi:hypothetical protein
MLGGCVDQEELGPIGQHQPDDITAQNAEPRQTARVVGYKFAVLTPRVHPIRTDSPQCDTVGEPLDRSRERFGERAPPSSGNDSPHAGGMDRYPAPSSSDTTPCSLEVRMWSPTILQSVRITPSILRLVAADAVSSLSGSANPARIDSRVEATSASAE